MALPDFPLLPPELAVDSPPLTDDDLATYFAVMDAGPNAGMSHTGQEDPEMAEAVELGAVVHGWRVEADDQAEWALRKLALANEELRRLAEQAQEWQARIGAWFQQAAHTHQRTAAYMEERLADYALRLREVGGPATLQLPSGTIKTTEQKPKVEVADDALLARMLDEALAEPTRALSEEDAAAYKAWRDAWAKLVAEADQPVELVKRTPKVYVGPLRKLVRAEERPTGQTRWVLSLSCDHELATVTDDDASEPARPKLGEGLACSLCPTDSIDGETISTVVAIEEIKLTELVPVGPDGEPVPGAMVNPGGIVPKVEAR